MKTLLATTAIIIATATASFADVRTDAADTVLAVDILSEVSKQLADQAAHQAHRVEIVKSSVDTFGDNLNDVLQDGGYNPHGGGTVEHGELLGFLPIIAQIISDAEGAASNEEFEALEAENFNLQQAQAYTYSQYAAATADLEVAEEAIADLEADLEFSDSEVDRLRNLVWDERDANEALQDEFDALQALKNAQYNNYVNLLNSNADLQNDYDDSVETIAYLNATVEGQFEEIQELNWDINDLEDEITDLNEELDAGEEAIDTLATVVSTLSSYDSNATVTDVMAHIESLGLSIEF